jgi:L-lactate dehydrogenase complex protein LldG
MAEKFIDGFTEAARRVGAEVVVVKTAEEGAAYVREKAGGGVLLPPSSSLERIGLGGLLRAAGAEVVEGHFRSAAPQAAAGVTGANFALADTGTVVLESTAEAVRLTTTLPERHFVFLDPRKILSDGLAAVPLLRRFNEQIPRNYLAYITGPSRTADIERVLTIGVHGPGELHIMLLSGLSEDFLEM